MSTMIISQYYEIQLALQILDNELYHKAKTTRVFELHNIIEKTFPLSNHYPIVINADYIRDEENNLVFVASMKSINYPEVCCEIRDTLDTTPVLKQNDTPDILNLYKFVCDANIELYASFKARNFVTLFNQPKVVLMECEDNEVLSSFYNERGNVYVCTPFALPESVNIEHAKIPMNQLYNEVTTKKGFQVIGTPTFVVTTNKLESNGVVTVRISLCYDYM
jgi:hypothetical protein